MSDNLESGKKMIGHDFDIDEIKDIFFCLDFTVKAINEQILNMKKCCHDEKFKEIYINIENMMQLREKFDLIIKTCEGDIPKSEYLA